MAVGGEGIVNGLGVGGMEPDCDSRIASLASLKRPNRLRNGNGVKQRGITAVG